MRVRQFTYICISVYMETAEGLIMTNAHVIANKEDALSAKITFRYDDNHQRGSDVSNVGESDKNDGDTRDTNQEEETEDARNTRSRYKLEVRLAPDEFFITSPKVAFTIPDAKHLDYTVVKLKLHRDAPSHCGSKETDTSTSNNRIENNKYIKNMISDGTPSNIDTTVKNNDRISEVNTNIEFTNNNIHENNDNNDNCTKDTNADSSTKVALELQRLKVVSSIIRSIPPLQIFHPATLRTIPHFRDVVGVIQHPQGRQKQYSEDRVTKVGKFFLRYKVS